jgi:recombination protein RecA
VKHELPAQVLSLDELFARRGRPAQANEERWGIGALRGRLVELSARGASATLTAAFELVAEAQAQAEPVAWISLAGSTFYPPDVAECGIDLAAIVVVRVPDAVTAARTAERLLRSGAFGLVMLDLAGVATALPTPVQGRLVTLAQTHDAAVVCLTEKTEDTSSLGSLVSLRAEALRRREGNARFGITVRALKDKQRGPGWTHVAKRRGPAGLL